MRIIATPCKGKDLLPGDLFSTAGPEYWGRGGSPGSIGEKVYIRTSTPAENAPDMDLAVFRLDIQRETTQEAKL